MKIEFINHACYIVDTGKVRILCDPWLHGQAFDRGWEHLIETPVKINDLDYDYIWISHEHPDHFSVQDLNEIKGPQTIFYQETRDKKVKAFLESKGHRVIEMHDWESFILPDNSKITVTKVDDDSWFHITDGNESILNLNDCEVITDKDLEKIKSKLGSIDVLMTQFGFAMWIGNEGDATANSMSAMNILSRVTRQAEILKPRYVLPFASYIKFCHKDNVWMNQHQNKPWDVWVKPADTIIMEPMDKWSVGDKWSNRGKWKKAFNDLDTYTYEDDIVPFPTLLDEFDKYVGRIKDKNSWLAIRVLKFAGFLPPTSIYLVDNEVGIDFCIVNGIKVNRLSQLECDISMCSETFLNILKFEWGRGTLTVNGRFTANYYTMWKFFRQTKIAYANNVGKTVPLSLSLRELLYSYTPKWVKE
jgi:UDP-MurNAc hydroxylase